MLSSTDKAISNLEHAQNKSKDTEIMLSHGYFIVNVHTDIFKRF